MALLIFQVELWAFEIWDISSLFSGHLFFVQLKKKERKTLKVSLWSSTKKSLFCCRQEKNGHRISSLKPLKSSHLILSSNKMSQAYLLYLLPIYALLHSFWSVVPLKCKKKWKIRSFKITSISLKVWNSNEFWRWKWKFAKGIIWRILDYQKNLGYLKYIRLEARAAWARAYFIKGGKKWRNVTRENCNFKLCKRLEMLKICLHYCYFPKAGHFFVQKMLPLDKIF